MFEVRTDHNKRLIYLRMSGVLAVDEALACAAAKEAAVGSLGPPYVHSTLVDIRGLRLQPQEIFAIFTNFVATTEYKSRKIAIVAGEGTARMQFRRVAERAPLRGDMRIFTGASEARAWLSDGAEEPVQQPLPGELSGRGPSSPSASPAV